MNRASDWQAILGAILLGLVILGGAYVSWQNPQAPRHHRLPG